MILGLGIGLGAGRKAEAAGTWATVATNAPGGIGLMLLLPDGTVMAVSNSNPSTTWYRLTPNASGSYINGTWSTIAPMHDSRLYFSSAVLQDGRVFVAGGEYGTGGATAEVYDPKTNIWTQTSPPASLLDPTKSSPLGFSSQGFSDSNCKIVADGSVLISPVMPGTSGGTLLYQPKTNTWSAGPKLFRGVYQDEASWVKLPDASIITIDPFGTNSERYIPGSNTWVNDGNLPANLYDPYGSEIGAGFLLPNGKAFFLGATGHTALYTPSGGVSPGTWAAGPDIPNGQGPPDAPAAMMVNGKILCAVSPIPTSANHFPKPTTFYEYDYLSNSFTLVSTPSGGVENYPTYVGNMLDLPDGTVLYSRFSSQLKVYQPDGSPLSAGKPSISNLSANSDGSFHLTGTLFNGISEGAAYGDDNQMDSNYPLVRLSNGSGNVSYGRTYNWSSTGVMTGGQAMSTEFAPPSGLAAGTYSLVVVANGIASNPISFPYAPPTATIGSVTAAEGDSGITNFTFPVTLASVSTSPVTLGYSVDGGTATPGMDYGTASDSDGATPGVLTIAAGATTGTITVPVVGDTDAEANETFNVTLSNPNNVVLGTPSVGVGTINNDDVLRVVSITRALANPTTAASVPFTVTFNASVSGVDTSDFTLATAGSISGAAISSVSGTRSTYTVTVSGISGAGTIRLNAVDDDSITDGTNILGSVGSGNGSFSLGESYTRNDPNAASTTPATSGAIISEFRLRGAGGSGDEYVEILNKGNAPLNIGGWGIKTNTGTLAAPVFQTTLVPQNTVIPVFGHFLFTGGSYSLSGLAASDALMSGDTSDASGVALLNAAGAVQDAVGFTASDSSLREGAGLPNYPTANGEYAFMRDFIVSQSKDTADSTNDFVFVSTTGAAVAGTPATVAAQLGAPSPEGLTSPAYFNNQTLTTLLDTTVSAGASPNRVRVRDTGLGFLVVRRTIRNNSLVPLKQLRFSVTAISSLGSAGDTGTGSGQADVRLTSQLAESGVMLANNTSVNVEGTTLEAATGQPQQPLGGALGSSLDNGTVTLATPLMPGATRNYAFRLQIVRLGNFFIALNILALPQ